MLLGIKIAYGGISDLVEARAISHKNDDIHIYSNSWGPKEWGFVVSGPGYLVTQALETAIAQV